MKKSMCLVLLAIVFVSGTVMAESQPIRGAGSTFAAAAYTSWGFSYQKERNVPIVYEATGSGDGIKQILEHKVDFGATDHPLSQQELNKNRLIQFPSLVSGIVPVLNVPGVKAGQLKLTGSVLAGIFSGRIAKWNAPEIQALNPEIMMPALGITRVVRADASGSTAIFTEYLAKSSSDWASQFGTGTTVRWPKDTEAAKGNDGMHAAVAAQPGAIGYVTANQVFRSKLVYPLLMNKSRQFTAPTEEALYAAVKSTPIKHEEDKLTFIDAPGPGAWPIADATYILIERSPRNPEQAARVLKFFYWAFLRGDGMASETGYVPLPSNIQARAVGAFRQVRDASDNPINFMTHGPRSHAAQLAAYAQRVPVLQ